MGLILRIQGQKAILRDGEWSSADARLEERLNTATRAWVLATGGPALDSPDPEREVAREMCRQMGGRVLLHTPANAKRAYRVYFNHRQYHFDF